MKKKNGFTLIELLAVIIILGILMIIAIPSVTSYINNSRKSAYVDSAKEIIAGARNFVNEGRVPMYDTSATYYIKSSCISTENGQKSPYGDFVDDETYVIVTYDGKGYDYYWVSRDTTGQGVSAPTALKDLDEDDIKSDIALGTIIPTKISDDKSNVQVINTACNGFDEVTEDGSGEVTPVSITPKYFAFGNPSTSSSQDYASVTAVHGISQETIHPRVFATLYSDESTYGLCIDYSSELVCFKGGNDGEFVSESREHAKNTLSSEDASFNSCIDAGSQCYPDDNGGVSTDISISSDGSIEIYANHYVSGDEPFLCRLSSTNSVRCNFEW